MSQFSGERGTSFDYQAALRLDGQRILVLGTGAGVGSNVAAALSQAGAKVGCVDLVDKVAGAAAKRIDGYALSCDVCNEESFRSMLSEAEQKMGGVTGIVDVVARSKMGRLASLSYIDWEETFKGVIGHAFLALTAGAEVIERNGGGALCFVGSNSGLSVVKGQAAYGSAKAALHHLVACAGAELGRKNIRVNAVAPSFIRNPRLEQWLTADDWSAVIERIPMGRVATPADVAATILFLMSPLAGHISGQTLAIDGGFTKVLQLPLLPWNRDVD